jgi:hypothetical protein
MLGKYQVATKLVASRVVLSSIELVILVRFWGPTSFLTVYVSPYRFHLNSWSCVSWKQLPKMSPVNLVLPHVANRQAVKRPWYDLMPETLAQSANNVASGHLVKLNGTPWPGSARELCRPSDRRLSAKLVPTFADRGCHMVSVTDSYGRIPGLLAAAATFSLNPVCRPKCVSACTSSVMNLWLCHVFGRTFWSFSCQWTFSTIICH